MIFHHALYPLFYTAFKIIIYHFITLSISIVIDVTISNITLSIVISIVVINTLRVGSFPSLVRYRAVY
jgi:hypothetical protein